jgi:alkylation response protein AidB-like acyl-CoA dehydrogenase
MGTFDTELMTDPTQAMTTPAQLRELAAEVRSYLRTRRAEGAFEPHCDGWADDWNREFSRELASRGWVGMTIPTEYGGGGRSHPERFVVAEEILAAGAPVAAHWVTERQIAPQIIRLGSEDQRRRFLPGIAAGEISFCLGMSEPGSGSDLASVRTRAKPAEGGWTVADYMLALVRTSDEDDHHAGLSQLIIDLHAPGVDARPILAMVGDDHFAEVFIDDAFVPEENVLGSIGAGWRQVTTELGYERGGSDRFMSNLPLLQEFVARTDAADDHTYAQVGELVARGVAQRALAMDVMEAAGSGGDFAADAALAKDAGNLYEQDTAEALRTLGVPADDEVLVPMLEHAVLFAPTITLRGGSTEVLRGITARQLVGR